MHLPRTSHSPVVNVGNSGGVVQFPLTSAPKAKQRAFVFRTEPVDETPPKPGTKANPIDIFSGESDSPTPKPRFATSDSGSKLRWF